MPLRPVPLFPIDIERLAPRDFQRDIVAIHVHATVQRHSYLNGPRRPFTWRIFLKLNGGRDSESGSWDIVELVLKPSLCQIVDIRAAGRIITSVAPATSSAPTTGTGGGMTLKFSSTSYPEYGNPFSGETSRFLSELSTTSPKMLYTLSKSSTTVQNVIDILQTCSFHSDASSFSGLERSAKVWDQELGNVGDLAWVLDVLRTLESGGILKVGQSDQLCLEFSQSPSRYELAEGSTIIV